MGDPKKQRKKYKTPTHPWQAERINSEKIMLKDYGLKNKSEIWKMISKLKKFKEQIKALIRMEGPQAEKEEKQLRDKLVKLGLVEEDKKLEDVLDLNVETLLERRLQTVVFKKGFAKTIKQARQFIVHGHISIGDQRVTVPSYLVQLGEEMQLTFRPTSSLSNPEHSERAAQEPKLVEKETKEKVEEKNA